MWSPDAYTAALNFAARAHRGQTVPGSDDPYLRHVATVAAEVMSAIAARGGVEDADLAVQCALLHDTVEDTPVTLDELQTEFGAAVAAGVSALTKDDGLATKPEKMADSLRRIREQPRAVWMVKLADRVTNLQPPPGHWDDAKIARYREEAKEIHAQLHEACEVLGARILEKIEGYGRA